MILSEQIWRILISAGVGGIAAGVATLIQQARKEPAIPIVAGVAAAVTAYAIDVYTERRQHAE